VIRFRPSVLEQSPDLKLEERRHLGKLDESRGRPFL